jgi:hypothetical protein
VRFLLTYLLLMAVFAFGFLVASAFATDGD